MNEELSALEKELNSIIEAEKKELGVEEEPETEQGSDEVEETIEEQPEPKEETPEETKKEEEQPKATPDVYYKLREEARKREALEKELAALKTPTKAPIPSPDEDIEGHLKGELEQVKETLNSVLGVVGQDLLVKKEEQEIESAFEILGQFEKRITQEKPDYEQARNHLAKIYAEEYKLKNPDLKGKHLIQAVAKEIIAVADYAAANNQDPAAFIYERASLYGYKPEAKEVKQEPAKKQPDLTKIAANKEKSAGMAAAASSGAANILTFEMLEKMSNEERAKLTATDWARMGA